MDVIFLNPAFPIEMPDFVRGLAQVGARVWAVGDRPAEALPTKARANITGTARLSTLRACSSQPRGAALKGRR